MAGTKTMNIMKGIFFAINIIITIFIFEEITMKTHSAIEKEVEQRCSEWLRHSSQRLKKEKTTTVYSFCVFF